MTSFSRFLLDIVEDMDEDFESLRRRSQGNQAEPVERRAEKWVEYLLGSLEGFSPSAQNGLEAQWVSRTSPVRDRDILQSFFDEHYSKELLNKVPKMVRRTMRLSPLIAQEMPSHPVNLYLKEATRSHVFGFFQGSVALSRAAVEQGLREKVQSRLRPSQTKFYDLVTAATRLRFLDEEKAKKASQVEAAGNRVLHGRPSNELESWATLDAARDVLAHLYSSEN